MSEATLEKGAAESPEGPPIAALVFILGLQSLYYLTILRNTTDAKLDAAKL